MDFYVSKNLSEDESVVHITHPHWIVFAEGSVWMIGSLMIGGGWLPLDMLGAEWYLGVFLFLMAAIRLIAALFYYIGTELGVTNKRLIGKVGIVTRTTVEIDHSRIESINVHQSVLGRLLKYGTVTIRGIGGTPIPVHTINDPITFRNARMVGLKVYKERFEKHK